MNQMPVSEAGHAVELVRVRKEFGNTVGVSDVSLRIGKGEFVTLLGPSGCGKSTLLGMIAGFVAPSAGKIIVDEFDITDVESYRRDIGMVFQSYALFPHMNVFDNIAFGCKMRKLPKAQVEADVRRAIDMMKLGGFEHRSVKQLSGGQQQRVALARAIVIRPKVLLLDEPLSALDKNLRAQMQIEIKHLQQKLGVTVVFVTHDQTEALTMADRVAVLDGGRLQQIGAPRDLYETPATPFVAGFIGETNFLRGTARGAAGAGARVGVTLAGGVDVEATAVDPLRAGQNLRLAIRPERLSLADATAPLSGTIQEVIYVGSATTCVVALPGGETLRARVPAGQGSFSPGERVAIAFRTEDARCFGGDA